MKETYRIVELVNYQLGFKYRIEKFWGFEIFGMMVGCWLTLYYNHKGKKQWTGKETFNNGRDDRRMELLFKQFHEAINWTETRQKEIERMNEQKVYDKQKSVQKNNVLRQIKMK